MTKLVAVLVALLAFVPAAAQQSASFKVNEHVFDGGGYPDGVTALSSANFRITLDSIGEDVAGPEFGSGSFRMSASFVDSYPPASEVHGLLFTGPSALVWDGERSAGSYNIYRDLISSLSGPGDGACFQNELADTTGTDPGTPPSGNGWFYLVTVKNRLAEEGTKGYRSDGSERASAAPCP